MIKQGKLVKFDPDEVKRITRVARKERISANEWIRKACREKLDRDIAIAAAQTAQEEHES